MFTPTDTKKYEQMAVDGAIQGAVVLGEMYMANELGLTKKSKPVKSAVLVGAIILSEFTMPWFKKQKFCPNI